MKLTQQDKTFSPIAIILETQEEAELFWDMMRQFEGLISRDMPTRQMAIDISNMFSNEAKL